MYAIINKNREGRADHPVKKGKEFFLLTEFINKDVDTKKIISKQISDDVNSDIKEMLQIMTNNIIGGMLHSKR